MKTALIVGGSSGIGRAAAEALAREGFRVGLVGRSDTRLKAAVEAIRESGGEAWSCALDVRDRPAVQSFVAEAAERYGNIDLLVYCAGSFQMRPFEETDGNFWDETLASNLTGAYNFARAVWPHIQGGQIINVGSIAAFKAYPGNSAYSASKHGLTGLSEVLALEGKRRGIRVHLLAPGNTDTPIWEGQAPDAVRRRMMQPEQVAEAIRWLACSPPEVTFQPIVMLPARDVWGQEDS